MDDYIRKQDAITATCKGFCHPGVRCPETPCREQTKYLRGLPAADVAPVVHAYWRDTGSGQECSACKEIQYGYDTGRYFCANCGADMRGEQEKEVIENEQLSKLWSTYNRRSV
jgi:hypothetical protein